MVPGDFYFSKGFMDDDIITKEKTESKDQALGWAQRFLANEGHDGKYIYCLQDGKFYSYKQGYWKEVFEKQLLRAISIALPKTNNHTIFKRKQILENMKILAYKDQSEFNWSELMNLENGMVNPYKQEMEDHDLSYYSTIRIPYKFDCEFQCPLWIKSIGEILEDSVDKIELMQEFFGYCTIPDVKQKKAMLFIGESDSGKSTLLNILRAMLGKDNCSAIPLKYLSNPQYTPRMVNKLVNIDPDVAKDALNYEGDFKIITSGEPVNCNQKFIESFDFIPYCRIVLAANDFPNITDYSSAFYTRLLLIPCDRVFNEQEKDRELFDKLEPELPGILNWALEGLKRLNARGYFKDLEFNKKAVQELRDQNNPVEGYLRDNLRHEMDQEIDKEWLYNQYRHWCDKNEVGAISSIKFNQKVFAKFSKYTGKDCRASKPPRPRVWRNLVFKTDYNSANWED